MLSSSSHEGNGLQSPAGGSPGGAGHGPGAICPGVGAHGTALVAAVAVPARLPFASQGLAPALSPLRAGEQQRVLKPPFSTNIGRACARWCVPSFCREERRCSCVLILPVNCTSSKEPARLPGDVAVSAGPGELQAFPPAQDTACCCWTMPCKGGEGAWRSHCSAASCPLPLASLIHL